MRYAAIDTLAGSHALMMGFLVELAFLMTCSPDCYQSEVESGSFMMVG